MSEERLPDAELEVMACLWQLRQATAPSSAKPWPITDRWRTLPWSPCWDDWKPRGC